MSEKLKTSSTVFITNVSPLVEGGQYKAKSAAGEPLVVAADIFTYGHEEIAASVVMKAAGSRQWKEYPMVFKHNDHWEFELFPEDEGIYQFKVQGWATPYSTWLKGLVKKQKAGIDVTVELQIGVGLIETTAAKANPKDKKILQQYAGKLANEEDVEKAIAVAAEKDLLELMQSCRNAAAVTVYPKTITVEVERRKAAFSAWYELFPRSASPERDKHGTFKDVEALLPRIARMGFDTLYLPPVHPIGEMKRKGKDNALEAASGDPGSPWAIGSKLGGHTSVHPELGTVKDFQQLIKAAKKLDIEIAMDIAFQCAPDHPYVKQHPEWFKWRPDGTVQYAENPPKRYEDILPFDFETSDRDGLWNELLKVVRFWISKGVRVFRVDNPHTKAFDFWEWLIASVREEYPEVIFLAEAFTRPRIMERLGKIGFNQSYTYFTWRYTKKDFEQYMNELVKSSMRHYFRPNFWPNTPDILPPHLVSGGENMHLIRLILAATLSSNYGVYGPVYEFGITEAMPGKEEYAHNEKYEIRHWDWNAETRISDVMELLNRIRRENAALQSTWNIEFAETTNDQILCYIKRDKRSNNTLIIAVNLDPHQTQSGDVILTAEQLGLEAGEQFAVRDLLSQDRYRWQPGRNFVQLNPYEMPAHILKIEQTS